MVGKKPVHLMKAGEAKRDRGGPRASLFPLKMYFLPPSHPVTSLPPTRLHHYLPVPPQAGVQAQFKIQTMIVIIIYAGTTGGGMPNNNEGKDRVVHLVRGDGHAFP
jgi:hypothetical protein